MTRKEDKSEQALWNFNVASLLRFNFLTFRTLTFRVLPAFRYFFFVTFAASIICIKNLGTQKLKNSKT